MVNDLIMELIDILLNLKLVQVNNFANLTLIVEFFYIKR